MRIRPHIKEEVLILLEKLISIESFSKTEDETADAMESYLKSKGIEVNRLLNNIWVKNLYFHPDKPTILLNSHHDTVKPNAKYCKNPFEPVYDGDKLYGLGSNDAGGPLISLLACFLYFYDRSDLKFNLIYAATAEEEISGKNGVEALLPKLGDIYFGIIGEPTNLDIAIAEKGLFVIDCTAHGVSGHAARDEGENAIYKAMKDIEWLGSYKFPKVSETLGHVKMTVTMIQAGLQHNIIPDTCTFTVDIRTTDEYSNKDVLQIIRENISSTIAPRTFRLNSSSLEKGHPMLRVAESLNRKLYGSPTMSDQALMDFPTFKIGPGDSARSHTADEYILLSEIEEGIDLYIKLLENYNLS